MESLWRTIDETIAACRTDVPTPPPPALAAAADAAAAAGRAGLFEGDTNPDGERWTRSLQSPDGDVWASKGRTHRNTMYRTSWRLPVPSDVDAEDSAATREFACGVFRTIVRPEERVKWDTEGLDRGAVVASFRTADGADVNVEVMATRPQMGGVVSPRFFCDVRHTVYTEDGVVSALRSIDAAVFPPLAAMDAAVKKTSLVRSTNYGGGVSAHCARGETHASVVMACQTNIGGWLPASVVEAVMASNLIKTVKGANGAVAKGAKEKKVKKAAAETTAGTEAQGTPEKETEQETEGAPPPSRSVQREGGAACGGERRRIRQPGVDDPARYSWRLSTAASTVTPVSP